MQKPKVYIIHDATLDGYISAHILRRYNIHYVDLLDINYIPYIHNEYLPELDYNNSIVFILGIKFSMLDIRDLISKVSSLNIFGNFEYEEKIDYPNTNIHVSKRTCTAMLVWGFYYSYSDPIPKILTLINNFNHGLELTTDSLYFNIAMETLNNTVDDNNLEELFNNEEKLTELINQGKTLWINLTTDEN